MMASSREKLMRITGARQLRQNLAEMLRSREPVLVTRHGRLSGVYLPLDDPEHLPNDLRRELTRVLAEHLSATLDMQGVDGDDVLADFDDHRQRRR